MDYFKKIIKESIVVIIMTVLIGFSTGIFLSTNEHVLYYFPIILIILPSLNGIIGDLSTVIVSRLTTHLFLGTIYPKIQKSKRLKDDFFSLLISMVLCLITIIIMGFSIGFFTGIDIVSPFLIILIILFSGLVLFNIMFIALFLCAIFLFKKGHDPNNFLIPIATTSADLLNPILIIILIISFI